MLSSKYEFSKNMPVDMMFISKLGSTALATYLIIIHCSSNYGVCFISNKVLAHTLHVNVSTAKSNIAKLVNCGAIALLITKDKKKIFMLNPNIVWHKGLSNNNRNKIIKRYKFSAHLSNFSLTNIGTGMNNIYRHSQRFIPVNK